MRTRKGKDLVNLKLQHFRLKDRPRVQIQIYNILDRDEKHVAFHLISHLQRKHMPYRGALRRTFTDSNLHERRLVNDSAGRLSVCAMRDNKTIN